MIKIKHKGDLKKTKKYLMHAAKYDPKSLLEKYGERGVAALREATPRDTGTTAESWYYEIHSSGNSHTIEFLNSNVQDYVNIAIILQYGHGTRNGGCIEGRDYINPGLQPVFDRLVDELTREVPKV
jgi:hypothetical protein